VWGSRRSLQRPFGPSLIPSPLPRGSGDKRSAALVVRRPAPILRGAADRRVGGGWLRPPGSGAAVLGARTRCLVTERFSALLLGTYRGCAQGCARN